MKPATERTDPVTGPVLVLLAILALFLTTAGVRLYDDRAGDPVTATAPASAEPADDAASDPSDPADPPADDDGGVAGGAPGDSVDTDALPRWRGERVFADDRMLVAYYGTAGTGALGVLGENRPEVAHQRLLREAATFDRPVRDVQPVYELIVSIADAYPGPDGDYSHDLERAAVEQYVAAARRQGALVILDIQTGRSDFLEIAQRWLWALRQPHVGLALDPEWRMGPGEVPGQVIGSVSAAEVNRVSAWLQDLTLRNDLPEKLFVLHQFRTDMLPDIERIEPRPGLAMVQHVDGFGTPSQKRATYHAVARPETFVMGFKLFYDEDIDRLDAGEVYRVRPRVRFVSFQ